MVDENKLDADLDQIKTLVVAKLAENSKEIADLKAQIAAGTPVSQEQLDGLDAKAQDIIAALSPA